MLQCNLQRVNSRHDCRKNVHTAIVASRGECGARLHIYQSHFAIRHYCAGRVFDHAVYDSAARLRPQEPGERREDNEME